MLIPETHTLLVGATALSRSSGAVQHLLFSRHVLGARRIRCVRRQQLVDLGLEAPQEADPGVREHACAGAGKDVPRQQLRRDVFFATTSWGFQVSRRFRVCNCFFLEN